MAHTNPDPKGYYRTLGVSAGVNDAAIKAAYRRRAKDLHPDLNPDADTHDAFQRLGEAYRVLRDPVTRRAYDRSGQADTKRPDPAQGPRRPTRESYRPHPCGCCGRIAAQPRHVVFPTVRGRLTRSEIGAIEGVFCRRCADLAGLRAARDTWLRGWWSLPWGPFHTLRAVWIALRGGVFPHAENHRLLMHQARAFLFRGDEDLARGLALQALAFADTETERRQARGVAAAVPAEGRRALRDRWRSPSLLRLLPGLPLAALVAAALVGVSYWKDRAVSPALPPAFLEDLPPSVTGIPGLRHPFLLRNGHLYEVTLPGLPLRAGPGGGFEVISQLDAGTVVMVSDNTPGGGWVRVFVTEDLSGYVSGRYLMPGLPQRTLDGGLR